MNIDLSDELLSSLRRIIRAVDIHSKSLLKKYGLTGPQLIVLSELERSKELSISAISKKVSLSQATVTTIINRLEQQGLLSRERNSLDKRRVNVRFSDKGEAILQKKPSLLQLDFVKKFNKLEEWEQYLLLSSVSKIASMMDAENINAEPVLTSEEKI
ncbi:MAG: MarR family transcriptional regulator [Spirochaetales bacterium]|uniref:MarR family transcriptional regulator n=1 Tax=Candidatus Thalassospirochaeta sargassi TaxID=3119039 RepID=A0AAJ1IIP9_9SPIO|nr:MarR family transcriptional regulator [Spirochaetales bacterium]